jgi:hypothetical protein
LLMTEAVSFVFHVLIIFLHGIEGMMI